MCDLYTRAMRRLNVQYSQIKLVVKIYKYTEVRIKVGNSLKESFNVTKGLNTTITSPLYSLTYIKNKHLKLHTENVQE